MDYDFDKIEISAHYNGEMLHVYSDRDNKTGPRSVFLIRERSAYVCHMDGNPADKDNFKVTSAPVTKEEAKWLVSAIARTQSNPEMGLGPNRWAVHRKTQDATFTVRTQADPSVVQEV